MRVSTLPGKFIATLLILVAQAAIALAAAPAGDTQQRQDQRAGIQLAQAQTQQVEAPVIKKRITIIFKKPPPPPPPPQQITILTDLPDCKFDTTYPSTQFRASGGTEPYIFTLSGKLPAQLTLTPSGQLSGIPVEEGEFSFLVSALDATQRNSGSRNYTLSCEMPKFDCDPGFVKIGENCVPVVTQAPVPPQITILTDLPDCKFDTAFPSTQFRASGGTEPYTFTFSGKLPPQLTLTPSGQLSGLPVEEGEFSFLVSALDATQRNSGSRNYTLSCEMPKFDCDPGMVRFGANCVVDGSSTIPPIVNVPAPPPPTVDYKYPLQIELKRIGCLTGRADGIWGRGSRRALGKFAGRAGLQLGSEPTQAALDAARLRPEGFCPREYVQPKKKKKKTKTYSRSPRCSKIKYAFTRGNTCGCSGGRRFNGSQCIKSGGGGGGGNNGPSLGDVLCEMARQQCNGQWYPPCTCRSFPTAPPLPRGEDCRRDELGRCY